MLCGLKEENKKKKPTKTTFAFIMPVEGKKWDNKPQWKCTTPYNGQLLSLRE